MKKLIVLALVALVASSAFAATDPVFTGNFSSWWAFSLTNPDGSTVDTSHTYEAFLDLGVTIDDYNTISATFDADGDTAHVLTLNSFNCTTDVTGVFGVDAFGLAVEFGSVKLEDVNVGGGVNDGEVETETANNIGMLFTITAADMITLKTVFLPEALIDDEDAEYGVTLEVAGIADMIDFSAYYIVSDNFDADGHGPHQDLDVATKVTLDILNFAVGFHQDFLGDTSALGLDVNLTMIDGLAIGVHWDTDDFSNFVDTMDAKLTLGLTMVEGLTANASFEVSNLGTTADMVLAADVVYDITDNFSVFGAMKANFDDFGALGYEVGLMTGLGALDVTLGFANQYDDDWEFKAPEDNLNEALFVKVSTSF